MIDKVVFTFNPNGNGEICITASSEGGGYWYQSIWIPRLLALGYADTVNEMLKAIKANEPYKTRYYARMVYRLAVTIFPFFRAEDEWPLSPSVSE